MIPTLENSQSNMNALDGWFASLTAEQIAQQQREIEQQLRSNGLAYGSVGQRSLAERPWHLDESPILIAPSEWQALEAGLQQRARLKEALFADIYGEQLLFKEGVLPAQVVFAHNGYLRVLKRVPSAWHLPLCNIDVTRSHDGRWLATGGSCQVPEYIGYALENRLVLSQVLNDPYRLGQVRRQAPYFRSLLSSLTNSMDIDERCVLLGYGANHPNHFEHAYLAKYLGYTLVETNDLTVRDQRVWLKTVAGLQRVDVILRFINDRDTDPLAYSDGYTGLGVPGLLHAAYVNNVQIINPMGVSTLDNPALDAYLEPLCQFYLNQSPLLPSPQTLWMGDASQCEYAQNNREKFRFKNINNTSVRGQQAGSNEESWQALQQEIDRTPHQWVAIEEIKREHQTSTVSQKPRHAPMTLRTYLVNTGEHFKALQGGLCLLDQQSPETEAPELAGSKDVWILSPEEVEEDTLLDPLTGDQPYTILEGELPSRVADNLFWFGRYAERVENTLRNLRSSLQLLRQMESSRAGPQPQFESLAIQLRATTTATGALPGFVGAGAAKRLSKPDNELHRLLFDENRDGCLANTLRSLLNTADSVRDRISYDLLRVLNQIADHGQSLQKESGQKRLAENQARMSRIIEHINLLIDGCAAISGMTHESFTHGDGWQFMMMGRRIERARQSTAVIGSVMLSAPDNPAALENLLRNFDSVMTYRSRYRSQLDAKLVLDLLLQDEANPRSVAYQFVHLDRSVRRLPGMRRVDHSEPLLKLVTAGLSRIRLADPVALLSDQQQQRQTLKKFVMIMEEITEKIAGALTAHYLTHTETPTNLDMASLLTAMLDAPAVQSKGDSA